MKKAVRTQVDERGDEASKRHAIDFTHEEDKTRQEFKSDTDVNQLLMRFGMDVPQMRPTFAEWDQSIDLQGAMGAIHEAKEAHKRLPAELRDRYPTWQTLLNAVESGQLKIDLSQPPREDRNNEAGDTGGTGKAPGGGATGGNGAGKGE